MTTYAAAGVNIELGDDVSRILYNAAKLTWQNRRGRLGELIVPFDDFSGVRAIDVSGLPEGTLMNIDFDGVGTKTEIAERVGDHRTIAYDLFAMICDDAVVRGAEPVLVGTVLDVNSLDSAEGPFLEQVKQLAEGYVGAAQAANVAIINGEVAELGHRVGGFDGFNYNWAGGVVWFARRDRLFTGREIREGDYLVGLKEEGFRSNGLSLVRRIMQEKGGALWHNETFNGGSVGQAVLAPSRVYSAAVVEMFGGYDQEAKAELHGVAHITGGGLPGKLGRMLKVSGLGARIDDPLHPSEIMLQVQFWGGVEDSEAYKTWNMGQGMVLATSDPEKVMGVAEEHGIHSKVIGRVTSEPGITIRSKGSYSNDQYLEF